MRVYAAPKVLVINEVGYLPLDELGATIFFQLVSARYERGSIILTSNKSYGDWGSIFGDPIIAVAGQFCRADIAEKVPEDLLSLAALEDKVQIRI